jgi:hypothetical protein
MSAYGSFFRVSGTRVNYTLAGAVLFVLIGYGAKMQATTVKKGRQKNG